MNGADMRKSLGLYLTAFSCVLMLVARWPAVLLSQLLYDSVPLQLARLCADPFVPVLWGAEESQWLCNEGVPQLGQSCVQEC